MGGTRSLRRCGALCGVRRRVWDRDVVARGALPVLLLPLVQQRRGKAARGRPRGQRRRRCCRRRRRRRRGMHRSVRGGKKVEVLSARSARRHALALAGGARRRERTHAPARLPGAATAAARPWVGGWGGVGVGVGGGARARRAVCTRARSAARAARRAAPAATRRRRFFGAPRASWRPLRGAAQDVMGSARAARLSRVNRSLPSRSRESAVAAAALWLWLRLLSMPVTHLSRGCGHERASERARPSWACALTTFIHILCSKLGSTSLPPFNEPFPA